MVAAIDWTNVLDTLIIAVPAIIAAVYAGRVHRKIQTPSGKAIGRQVEDALHTVLSNNYHLQSIGGKVGAVPPPRANGEAQQVEALTEDEDV